MRLMCTFVDFVSVMLMIMMRTVIFLIRPFVWVWDYFGAVRQSKRYIGKEFATAQDVIWNRERYTCPQAIDILKKLRCLPELHGFDSVITLLRHRHRTRAELRLLALQVDWESGKIGFNVSKSQLPLATTDEPLEV